MGPFIDRCDFQQVAYVVAPNYYDLLAVGLGKHIECYVLIT